MEELVGTARGLAQARGHEIVGTQHVLLPMTRQVDSFARRLLDEAGATEKLRTEIKVVLGA